MTTDKQKMDAIIKFYDGKMPLYPYADKVCEYAEKLIRCALTTDYDFSRLPVAGTYDNIVCGDIDTAMRLTLDLTARGDARPAKYAARAIMLIKENEKTVPAGVSNEERYGENSLFWKHARTDILNDRGATLRRKITLGRLIMYTSINKDWFENGATLDGLYNHITQ